MTKARIKRYWEQYLNHGSNYLRVHDVYRCPSQAKVRAEENIFEEMRIYRGYGYRVITHNAQMFTCGYLHVWKNGEIRFVVHTPEDRRSITVGHVDQYIEVLDSK